MADRPGRGPGRLLRGVGARTPPGARCPAATLRRPPNPGRGILVPWEPNRRPPAPPPSGWPPWPPCSPTRPGPSSASPSWTAAPGPPGSWPAGRRRRLHRHRAPQPAGRGRPARPGAAGPPPVRPARRPRCRPPGRGARRPGGTRRGAARGPARGPRGEPAGLGRTCYDHLAGRIGVAVTDAMVGRGLLAPDADLTPTRAGCTWFAAQGLDLTPPGRRPVTRACLDWTERRPHLAGHAGALLCRHTFDHGWCRRVGTDRAVEITPEGRSAWALCSASRREPGGCRAEPSRGLFRPQAPAGLSCARAPARP